MVGVTNNGTRVYGVADITGSGSKGFKIHALLASEFSLPYGGVKAGCPQPLPVPPTLATLTFSYAMRVKR